MVRILDSRLDLEVDRSTIQASYGNLVLEICTAFELLQDVSKLIFGKQRYPSIVLGPDHFLCGLEHLAFFLDGHRWIW